MAFSLRIFIVVFFFLISSNNVFAKIYPDVALNHKHHDAIDALSARKMVQGYPNGEFHPNGLINRAEAIKILVKSKYPSLLIENALDWHIKTNHRYAIFPDVPLWEWYSKYVEVSYQNNIINGYPNGQFKPANFINFAEALKIIFESYKINLNQNNFHPNKFLYVNSTDWFEKYFTYAHNHNLINKNKFYHPGQMITRGEFVEIIYRLEEILKNHSESYIDSKKINSNEYTITIPKLNIINVNVNFASIYDSTSALGILKYGLGNYLNPPDSYKKIVLFGHSSGYSWDHSNYKTILKEINKLSNGDHIYINYKEKGYIFEIYQSNIIPASQDAQLVQNNNDSNELILYTCWPPNHIEKRYVIYGKPI